MSGGGNGSGGLGVLVRQLLIVGALFWAMAQADIFAVLHPEGVEWTTMAAFGFIVLAAYTLGEMAEHVKLPHISGYLLAGVVCGDYFLGLLSHEVVAQLKVFDILAIALIAMEAGAALDIGGLKERWRSVAAITLALIVFSVAGGFGFAGLTSGVIPGIGLPFLEGQPTGVIIAVGSLLGVMILAASPPVTLAVISETKAKGPFTDTLLTSVIINNIQVVILFAVAVAVGHAATGGGGGSSGASAVLAQLGWSLALGAAIGALTGLVVRVIRDDALLAIVGICFVGSFVAEQLGASQLMTFLTAGAWLTTATRQGPFFKSAAGTLSGPVYVLFFTLVGADLHIDALIKTFPFAIAIVLLRLGTYFVSIRVADLAVGLSGPLKRFGFLGLAPQAGIALTIAIGAATEFHGWGEDFETLGLAAIALNEMVGPVLLKLALTFSGETGKSGQALEEDDEAEEIDGLSPSGEITGEIWQADDQSEDPFGGLPAVGVPALDELALEVGLNLRHTARDVAIGPIATRQMEAQAFLQGLRREFLRTHRRATVHASDEQLDSAEFRRLLIAERGELAIRWKVHLLGRASTVDFRMEQRAIQKALTRVRNQIDSLPSAVTCPLDPALLQPGEDDTGIDRLRKRLDRMRRTLSRGGSSRVVEVAELGEYYLGGYAPIYMLDVAGLFTVAERRLLANARNVFDVYDKALRELLEAERTSPDDPELRHSRLNSFRKELEAEFQEAQAEVDEIAEESALVVASALGRSYRRFAGSLAFAGTPALPKREYRLSRLYAQRREANQRLEAAFTNAQVSVQGMAGVLAMELELVRLEGQVAEATESVATETERDFRGRISLQLDRITEELSDGADRLAEVVAQRGQQGAALLEQVDSLTGPIVKVVDEAVAISERYRNQLREHHSFEPIYHALGRAIDELTDRYVAVFAGTSPTGRGLPPPPVSVEVEFRQVVRSVLESEVGRDLAELGQQIEAQVEQAWLGLNEIDRVLIFNRELTRTELELAGEELITRQTTEVLDETLVATARRMDRRVEALREAAAAFEEGLAERVRQAVERHLRDLHQELLSGRLLDARGRLGTTRRARLERVEGFTDRVIDTLSRSGELVESAIGEQTLEDARRGLGLPSAKGPAQPGPEVFAHPGPQSFVPMAYRRLFGDRTLEAGDLLVGHEDRVAQLRRLLTGKGKGSSRAVAIVGVGGPGTQRVITTLFRGLDEGARVVRHIFTEPVEDTEGLDTLAHEARQAARSEGTTIIVVDGFHWLYSARPGGFEALERFVTLVLETCDQVGWLVHADRPAWTYANRVLDLDAAFPERLEFEAFDEQGLRQAILARHAMSGFRLHFLRPEDSLVWRLRELIATKAQEHDLYEAWFFRRLHRDSGGDLPDALRQWMASIQSIDQGNDTMVLGTPPPSSSEALELLDDELLLVLRQVSRQGRITETELAQQFRINRADAKARLAQLWHWGLLVRGEGETYGLEPGHSGGIERVLAARRLVG